MVFEDISIFDEMDDSWLEGLIGKTDRIKTELKNPRSTMMLNPLKIKHLNNIDELESDIIVINLEDGVAPQMKKRALYLSAVFISKLKSSKSRIIVRVNPIDEGGKGEIELLNRVLPDAIRITKIKDADDVKKALKILDPNIDLHISVETKESLENLTRLNIDGKVKCCSLGIMDMLNSFGISQSILSFYNPTINYILSKFLLDAKTAGIYPIGFTYQEYENLDDFREWCKFEKNMGYAAKSCLGPKQVEIAHEIFSSSQDNINRAKEIREMFELKLQEGETGFMHKIYGFIDEPIYKDALLTLGKN